MYIDMETKNIIIPKGKWFIKNNKKIEDKYLLKMNRHQMAKKWNIYPAKEINKKDTKYWFIINTKYKNEDYVIIIEHEYEKKHTLDELKQIRINELFEIYKVYFSNWRNNMDAETFFEKVPHDDGATLKAAYDTDKAAIMGMTKYQELIDYQIMQSLINEVL